MKIQYLGTAAAEGIPAPFCACEVCKTARELGGREMRSRTQALVDGALLIDFPADTLYHAHRYGLDLSAVRHCIITHAHEDHFYPAELEMLTNWCSHPAPGMPKLRFYGSREIYNFGKKSFKEGKDGCEFVKVSPYKPFPAGEYTVTALPAVHGVADPYIYIVEKDGKSLLYAHDTDILHEDAWKYIKKCGVRLSMASLDCTEAECKPHEYIGHMDIKGATVFRDRLKELGAADENTVFILNHFSHNGKNPLYRDFSQFAEERGFLVSYDGMTVGV